MGRKKKQRKDDYWESAQSQEDYELLAAEKENLQSNEQTNPPKNAKKPKEQKAKPQDKDPQPELDPIEDENPPLVDLSMPEADPEEEAKDFTYGELDAAGVKV
jgi:hypothetical protein